MLTDSSVSWTDVHVPVWMAYSTSLIFPCVLSSCCAYIGNLSSNGFRGHAGKTNDMPHKNFNTNSAISVIVWIFSVGPFAVFQSLLYLKLENLSDLPYCAVTVPLYFACVCLMGLTCTHLKGYYTSWKSELDFVVNGEPELEEKYKRSIELRMKQLV